MQARLIISEHAHLFLNKEYVDRFSAGQKIPSYAWRLYHHIHQSSPNFFPFNSLDLNKPIEKVIKKECYVRVLLRKEEKCVWQVGAHDGFLVKALNGKKTISLPEQEIEITTDTENLFFNNKKVREVAVELKPCYGRLVLNGTEYEGSFILCQQDNKWLLINKLPLEKYLYSVLNSESWPGWPLEVNKAFAIASRSYVLSKMLEQRAKKRLYDVQDSNVHQTYRGFHKTKMLKQAVKETKGVVLVYQQRPILAMFDSCCGGVIPAYIQGVNFKKAPYLARQDACTFCKDSKLYTWRLEVDVQELETILKRNDQRIKTLSDITISKKDKAGVVQEIMLHSLRLKHSLDGKKLYAWLKPLKSYCYTIKKKNKKFFLEGKGYGHHLGMCQWGARAMVDHGFAYQQILHFYYPQTKLMKMSSTQTTV